MKPNGSDAKWNGTTQKRAPKASVAAEIRVVPFGDKFRVATPEDDEALAVLGSTGSMTHNDLEMVRKQTGLKIVVVDDSPTFPAWWNQKDYEDFLKAIGAFEDTHGRLPTPTELFGIVLKLGYVRQEPHQTCQAGQPPVSVVE